MESKLGVYICRGCEIGQSIDTEKLLGIAQGDNTVVQAKLGDVICNAEFVASIKAEISEKGINKVVIAGCSSRVFAELFNFGDDILTYRANLREQVVWCHEPNDEDTQMVAEDYLRMGIAALKASEPAVPFKEETSKDILVIGGGVTGMTAALSASKAGYKVNLVEKQDKLGGWAAKFKKEFPKQAPYQEPANTGIDMLIGQVEKDQNITVHKSTTIGKISGQPGKFAVSLKGNGNGQEEITTGAIVMAAGWKAYDPHKLGHLGYGASPDIVTNVEFEEMAFNNHLARPSNGKPIESVLFVQCAGSRDQEHLPYCSAVCCRVSLKQATYVREKYPDAKIYIIYKDIRTPAQYELFFSHVQNDLGVFLTKGEVGQVTQDTDGQISVDVSQTLLGQDITIKADVVVLATGMVPATRVDVDPAPGAENSETASQDASKEGLTADGKKEAAGAEKGAGILNLSYRQGTDLPTLKYGFPDSHFICFPYETRRTGIYAAGAVRAPMDLSSSRNDAFGAALKTIQAVEAVSRGVAVHPRSGDLSYPEFFMQRCTQCKRCTEECPFGTLDEDAKGTPLPNPFRCRRCGVCLGACPERIVSFKNYSVNMMSQMIKSIHIPDEFEEKPRILAFVCENDAMPAVDMAGMFRSKYNSMVRIIPLRCLGSMNIVWVGDALASGFDGVILIGCKKGDDYQCHYIRGSELAQTRMTNVREKLKQLVLEEDRVQLHELAITDYSRVPKIFDDFLEVINSVGPNPYKGM